MPTLHFPPFTLDSTNATLFRGQKKVALMPKDFELLAYLVTHAGQLVPKEELFQVVWGQTRVSPGVLKNGIERIRRTLGDRVKTPRFIETVQRRGYRFIAAVTAAPVPSSKFQVPSSDTQDSALNTQRSVLVGREVELAQLHVWLNKAVHGERQIVFVTGEPGIGKTTLIGAFLAQIADRQKVATISPQAPSLKSLTSEILGGAGTMY